MPNRGAARLLALMIVAGLLSVAVPASADERVPRPVLNVDFPDPAVVAAPGGLVAYATGDRVPHAWSRAADGPWRRGPSLLTHRLGHGAAEADVAVAAAHRAWAQAVDFEACAAALRRC